eukprot:5495433-Amphidinium_carterae.1
MQLRRVLRELWHVGKDRLLVPTSHSTGLGRRAAPLPRSWRIGATASQRLDEWAFLQDLDGIETQRLLNEEATATQEFFAEEQELMTALQQEATGLLAVEAGSLEEPSGLFSYYERYTAEGYIVFCRRLASGGNEEVLLDTSELAQSSKS